MKKILLASTFLVFASAALAQSPNTRLLLLPGGGGSSTTTIVSGTTTISGGADKQVCFNDAGVISCGSAGLTYTKSTGLLASTLFNATSAGSAAAPSISVGNATTGLYSISTTGFGVAINGVNELDFGITANMWRFGGSNNLSINVASGKILATTLEASGSVFGDSQIGVGAASTAIATSPSGVIWQFGVADAASPVAQQTQVQSVVAGTSNTNGANWTIVGSLSTGSGVSGDIIFQTGGTGAGAAVKNAATTALTIKGATQAVIAAGTFSATLANVATTSAVCYNTGSGLFTYDGTVGTCTVSAARFKNPIADLTVERNALDALHPAVWTYKDAAMGVGERVGLYADDVEHMDPRCVSYASDGQLQNYDERCVIAYLVMEIKAIKARLH